MKKLWEENSEKYLSEIPQTTIYSDYEKIIPRKDKEGQSKSIYCDVEFILGGGKRVGAHKAILAARSKYFEAMLCGRMMEGQSGVITLGDHISRKIFLSVLSYIYTDRLNVDVNHAIDIIPVANEFQLDRLKNICEGIIEKNVDVDSVAYVYQMASFYNANALKNFCLRIIAEDKEAVSKTEYWKELTPEDLAAINAFIEIFHHDPLSDHKQLMNIRENIESL